MNATPRRRALDDKVALVTGAGRGIGRAIALGFAAEGAAVACVSRTKEQIDGVRAAIVSAGGRGLASPADVTDARAIESAFADAVTAFGGVDVVVVNAGVSLDQRSVLESDPDAWRATLEVNLVGAYHTVRAAVPHLRARGGGNLIVVGSGMGRRAAGATSGYACSKAGLWMLTRVLAQELRDEGILVNELVPGPVATGIGNSSGTGNPALAVEWNKAPEDVVPLALFLATLPPKGPTGQTFSLTRREL